MIRTRKIAEELDLNMKIGDVEYQGDGGKAIFYYIADERVDFRKLIRILADTFKVRVEDKADRRPAGSRQNRRHRSLRATAVLRVVDDSFRLGRYRSGKDQDLSMNPQKLAGQCAKLKCCLNFETDIYAEAQKQLPPKDVQLGQRIICTISSRPTSSPGP